MSITDLITFIILLLCAGVAWRLRKLTAAGAITGGLLGIVLYLATAWVGIALMATFFLLGTAATAHRKESKRKFEAAEEKRGRTAGQVLANGGVAGVLALLVLMQPDFLHQPLLWIAGSFSAATADTLSSELGTVYGRRFFDILSFRKGRKGDDGVVSWEGTGFGFLGSALIALVYSLFTGGASHFLPILVAGTVGNLIDSLLGATLERRGRLSNNSVNFLNTAAGALTAGLLTI